MKHAELIIKSLNIKEEAYYNMLFECGCYYLQIRLGDDHVACEASKIPMFWAWWKNQWNIRDKEFVRLSNIALINEQLEGSTRNAAIELYNDVHNPNYLQVTPNIYTRIEINKILINEIGKTELSDRK